MIDLLKGLTLAQRLQVLKATLRLVWLLRRGIIRKAAPAFRKVQEWARDWISQGYQVDRAEKKQRFVRLSKAHGLLRPTEELEQLYEDLSHASKTRRMAGKTRRRDRK